MSFLARRSDPRFVLQLVLAAIAWMAESDAHAQAPTLPAGSTHEPGSMGSTLGPMPGAGVSPFGIVPGTTSGFLSGRAGTGFPRVPTAISAPAEMGPLAPSAIAAPPRLTITNVPLYGPLSLPDAAEDDGSADGLTLDAAIERLLRDNLALKTRRSQIPQARADVITARLRANPILYADSQLVPYGQYQHEKPGGPAQYDLNVSQPVDFSFKRLARTASAERVVDVLEAQYQDAVRIQIDNLYTAFIDVLAARETIRFAEASVVGLRRVLKANKALFRDRDTTRVDVQRARALLTAAELNVMQSEETLRRTKRTLAGLLNLPPEGAEVLEVRGTIADKSSPPPSVEELTRLALASRPDLAAMNLGVIRSEADVTLARANRFADAYVLYQPYTFQDNAPVGAKSSTSWALGVTMPVPIYNRNQGGVVRARLNVDQTRNEAAAIERRIAAEVRNTEREYAVSKALLVRYEADLLPAAKQERDVSFKLFVAGELTALDAYNAERNYNEAVRRYRDTLVRHRRAMLALNTVLAQRVFP